jgi:2,4-dienoyl-CoA reductase-like NADH-dependent reductase (Old Yellow Enzyme family)
VEELQGPAMGKNRSNAQKHLQEQEDEEEKNKKVHVAHYKDYAACVQLLHPGIDDKSRLSNLDSDIICMQQSIHGHDTKQAPKLFSQFVGWKGGRDFCAL